MHVLVIFTSQTSNNYKLAYVNKTDARIAYEKACTAIIRNEAVELEDDFGHLAFIRGIDILFPMLADLEEEHKMQEEQSVIAQEASIRTNRRLEALIGKMPANLNVVK